MNQLVSYDGKTISYDKDGNRTSDDKFDYSWNSLGQLVKLVNKSDNDTWNYQYDELGRRIMKTHNNDKINYHYDGDSIYLLGESQNGQIIRSYIRDKNGKLLGIKVGDKVYNYHTNTRGDVVGISDQFGNIQASYEYDSWGNILKQDIKDDNLKSQPFKYANYFYDTESNQYYLISRYYIPKQSVFLSIDPDLGADETVGMHNGYLYANNNSIKNIDPAGNAWQSADISGGGGYSSNSTGGGASFGTKVKVTRTTKTYSYSQAFTNAKNNWAPTANHIYIYSTKMPSSGQSYSSIDLYGARGLKQRRYFGANGKPVLDIDYYHSSSPKQNVRFLHSHTWGKNGRSKH